MKNFYWMVLIGAAFLLSACSQPVKKHGQNQFGGSVTGGAPGSAGSSLLSSGPPPSVPTQSQEQQSPSSSAVISPSTGGPSSEGGSQEPYGTPVPGKSGLVTSPFSPSAGYVDVRGYPPGQEVKCPFTGKRFRVP